MFFFLRFETPDNDEDNKKIDRMCSSKKFMHRKRQMNLNRCVMQYNHQICIEFLMHLCRGRAPDDNSGVHSSQSL